MSARPSRIPNLFWAYAALVLWGLLATQLLNRTPFGVDEGTARVMLFLWSVVDQVASPIVVLGVPDFRAVFLIPAGFLFPGSLLAGKLLTLVLAAVAVLAVFRWRSRSGDAEGALLASGLLLLSPLLLQQIDAIGLGPYLLFVFVAGAWLDVWYRETPHAFGGLYFAQLMLCLTAVTLHPAGLAYPAVLAWAWYREPLARNPAMPVHGNTRIHFWVGIAAVTVGGLLLAAGWPHVRWFGNPVLALSDALFGADADPGADAGLARWVVGTLLLLVTVTVVWRRFASGFGDLFGRMVLLSLVPALATGDTVLALIALVVVLFWGFPLLLEAPLGALPGFIGQRGIAFALVIVVATAFLYSDKQTYLLLKDGPALTAQDRVIKALADTIDESRPEAAAAAGGGAAKAGPRVASQWPGRTMVACRCSTLPLPPVVEDEAALLRMLRGIDYVVFDPRYPGNGALSHNLALLGGQTAETLALQPGGVIVRIHAPQPAPAAPAPMGSG